MNEKKYELIMCIVNTGFSDIVMDAAKEVGARGGTVIHARGTASKEAEEFFHITIQPDKEIIMILVTVDIKDDVLHAIYRSAGLKTDGQGIAFSVPVNHVVGISDGISIPIATSKDDKDDSADNGKTQSDAAEGEQTENEP